MVPMITEITITRFGVRSISVLVQVLILEISSLVVNGLRLNFIEVLRVKLQNTHIFSVCQMMPMVTIVAIFRFCVRSHIIFVLSLAAIKSAHGMWIVARPVLCFLRKLIVFFLLFGIIKLFLIGISIFIIVTIVILLVIVLIIIVVLILSILVRHLGWLFLLLLLLFCRSFRRSMHWCSSWLSRFLLSWSQLRLGLGLAPCLSRLATNKILR